MKIAVIGTGYVGLVAGTCFSDTGNTVVCVDQDESKVQRLREGDVPIYEPGLRVLVEKNADLGRLTFTSSTTDAVRDSEIIFMAVGTPPLPSGEPDLQYLESASRAVGQAMVGPVTVVNKSTVPVGAHALVSKWISDETSHPVEVVSNPEFLKEGSAVDDFFRPDRVIIGTQNREVYEKMAELYYPFVRQGNPIIWMDPTSAEMTKYACNAFLATRISFMNEMSQLCEQLGGDIESIRKGMSTDVRIGKHFLYAGVGYGGSCFPKDVKALISTFAKSDLPASIIRSVEEANERQKAHMLSWVKERFGSDLTGRTFALWGLSFKPNTDDIREAPAKVIVDGLREMGAKVQAFDPIAMKNAETQWGTEGIQYCSDTYAALEGADALLVVTEWNEFRQVDLPRVKQLLKQPVVFDGRNVYSTKVMREHGIEHRGIGRPEATA
jgi:UDPglucose 6-dehydrogenase